MSSCDAKLKTENQIAEIMNYANYENHNILAMGNEFSSNNVSVS